VYVVPFNNPNAGTEVVVAETAVVNAVTPPDTSVTLYPVIGDPPLFVGALQETIAALLFITAERAVGGSGEFVDIEPRGVDVTVAEEEPRVFTAETENV
jgi:hypothetical protein